VGKVSQVKSNGKRYDFKPLLETSEKRLDLNDLLKRAKDQEKNDKKLNLLIYVGATFVIVVFVSILSI